MSFVIGIDGPAGSGKGTISKKVAKILGLTNTDTGITYRCVAKEVLNRNISIDNKEEIIKISKEIDIKIENNEDTDIVFLDGKDVTNDIRSKEVTEIVSSVSSIKEVRYNMVELQRKLCKGKDVIVEGRDICTVVFPDADVKIYLDASIEERARRRYSENMEKGINMPYEEVLQSIQKRDYLDRNKEVGSLRITDESIIVDTTSLTIDQVVEKIVEIIKKNKEL